MKAISGDKARRLTFVGVTSSRRALLQAPVSGLPCVHWRLRIVEQVHASLQLVHEIASTEDFELTWSGSGSAAPRDRSLATTTASSGSSGLSGSPAGSSAIANASRQIRVLPENARIEAHPVLHRPGSPGALAVGKQFGFAGSLSVEEVALRPGEEVVAEGILEESDGVSGGPFRAVARDAELLDVTVRLPTRVALGPVLLPWALGTAAALLGGVGVATWVAWHFDLMPHAHHGVMVPLGEVGPDHPVRRHFSQPE